MDNKWLPLSKAFQSEVSSILGDDFSVAGMFIYRKLDRILGYRPKIFKELEKRTMPKADLFLDKRAHSRIATKIPVTYRLMDDQEEIKNIRELGSKTKNAETMDTSLGGMYIVANQALKLGTLLSLKISIPDKMNPLTAFAEVAWANETGAGIHFLAMKEEDMGLLAAYLNKISSAG